MTHDTAPPKRIWTFDRYVNGILMAEGVEIEKAETFEQAAKAAVRLASSGPKGEAPVLVLRDTSEVEAMVAAALRGAADLADTTFSGSGTDAAMVIRHAILASIHQPAAAALDKLIAEAEARGMEQAAEWHDVRSKEDMAAAAEFRADGVDDGSVAACLADALCHRESAAHFRAEAAALRAANGATP